MVTHFCTWLTLCLFVHVETAFFHSGFSFTSFGFKPNCRVLSLMLAQVIIFVVKALPKFPCSSIEITPPTSCTCSLILSKDAFAEFYDEIKCIIFTRCSLMRQVKSSSPVSLSLNITRILYILHIKLGRVLYIRLDLFCLVLKCF